MHTPLTKAPLFQKREDISIDKRFLIAYIVTYQSSWGKVTRLANKNNVSRQFIYNTAKLFNHFLDVCFSENKLTSHTYDSLRTILSYRMEGKCSIPSISTIMKRQNMPNNSVGFISETILNVGRKLGNDIHMPDTDSFTFIICSDEIFFSGHPILITVDPISMLILKIELGEKRDKDAWAEHWQSIEKQDITIAKIIKDEGLGMKAAASLEMFKDIEIQSDTFHGVAHRLGLYVNRLLSKAYKIIGIEYECERLLSNAKTEKTRTKRTEKYEESKNEAIIAIEIYQNFIFLYHCLLECFQVFDKNGYLNDQQKVIADFDMALDLIKTLNIKEINDEIVSIENCKSDLFTFYRSAGVIHQKLSKDFDNEQLRFLCMAWQCQKNWIKAKNSNRHNMFKYRELHLLNHAKELCGENSGTIKTTVYEQLNYIVQSSAAVECINSILRPYLNTAKNYVSQEALNLFMFYHNHRRFKSGLRKGKTPMEIATQTHSQADWLDLVVQKIQQN
jgi:hypothetical protein